MRTMLLVFMMMSMTAVSFLQPNMRMEGKMFTTKQVAAVIALFLSDVNAGSKVAKPAKVIANEPTPKPRPGSRDEPPYPAPKGMRWVWVDKPLPGHWKLEADLFIIDNPFPKTPRKRAVKT